jgi:transglutaminase-like putative cysteine protease
VSTALGSRVGLGDRLGEFPTAYRAFALTGAAVLTGAYLAALYHVVDVVGGPGGLELFVALVAGSLGLAVVLGRTLRLRYAVAIGLAFLIAGLAAYLLAIPEGTFDVESQLRDTVALLTGLSVLRMTKAAVWALGFTPGPLFVSTYLFVRRRYALGVLVGGGALAFFISTGDVDVVHGLVGALGAVATLGFGRLDREGGTPAQRDAVVALLVAVLVVTTSVSLVPGGEARPLLPGDRGDTVESSLVDGGDSVTVLGSIELSPTVRFTVTADGPARWRAGAFDRYTGSGWVRSGQSQPYQGALNRPIADERALLRQTFEVRSATNVMPAAWKPVRLESGGDRALVTSMGALEPRDGLDEGDQYTVVSVQGRPGPTTLRNAGTEYPAELPDRYTQLPESTPARLGEFTTQLTAEADNPYDTARVIEQWLEANKAYSLDVDRPGGDVAASFVFEMEAGYCTYFATAMVTMLRTQGVPARFVTGYTAGDQTGENQWTVRGLDSHAWVEAYFPGQGWVAFDPTPAGPRREAEQASLAQAQAAGAPNVGPEPSTPEELTPEAGPSSPAPTGTFADGERAGTPTIPAGLLGGGGGGAGSTDGGLGSGLPDGQTLLYGLILLVGAATAAQRTGLLERGRRLVWIRRTPDGPPQRRVEATFDRLDYLLGRQFRPRRDDETPRDEEGE